MRSLELKIPPAVLVLVCAGLMKLLAVAAPALTFLFCGRVSVAWLIVLTGVAAEILGIVSFRRARTTVNPMKPGNASSLVVDGIYRFTRNPMYVGIVFILLGWAVVLANPLALVPIALFIAYMNRFQIAPEERALEALFSEDYKTYKTRVRRWL